MSNRYCSSTGKIAYANRAEASAAARAVNSRKTNGGLAPFACHQCGAWHIGRGRSGPVHRERQRRPA